MAKPSPRSLQDRLYQSRPSRPQRRNGNSNICVAFRGKRGSAHPEQSFEASQPVFTLRQDVKALECGRTSAEKLIYLNDKVTDPVAVRWKAKVRPGRVRGPGKALTQQGFAHGGSSSTRGFV